jgi:AcrR family transcriptional regulator
VTGVPQRLPRGRHGLSRAEVEGAQRERILRAMADAMREKGYARTPVEDVIKRAGVSRETFYRLFRSKPDCFMAAFEEAGRRLMEHVAERGATEDEADPARRFERHLAAYLDGLASEPALARLFLIAVHAAGPEAIARRLQAQGEYAGAVAEVLGVTPEQGRFACRLLVSALSTMVTGPLAGDDFDALRALGPPVVEHVRTLLEAGVLR